MSEQKYPFWLEIYKGEGRYAVEPILLNYWGMYINSGEYRILDENADAITIASADGSNNMTGAINAKAS